MIEAPKKLQKFQEDLMQEIEAQLVGVCEVCKDSMLKAVNYLNGPATVIKGFICDNPSCSRKAFGEKTMNKSMLLQNKILAPKFLKALQQSLSDYINENNQGFLPHFYSKLTEQSSMNKQMKIKTIKRLEQVKDEMFLSFKQSRKRFKALLESFPSEKITKKSIDSQTLKFIFLLGAYWQQEKTQFRQIEIDKRQIRNLLEQLQLKRQTINQSTRRVDQILLASLSSLQAI